MTILRHLGSSMGTERSGKRQARVLRLGMSIRVRERDLYRYIQGAEK